ncbi:MAG: transcription-repair coupling factor [Myxococcota bacterium]|nr:transcription-repair coupling factor [Myxococcota bacterium]
MAFEPTTSLAPSENFPVAAVIEKIESGARRIDITGLELNGLAFMVDHLQRSLKQPVLCVVPHQSDALRLRSDVECYRPSETRIGYLPTIDMSPYGHLSPDRQAVTALLGELACLAWDHVAPIMVTSAGLLARSLMPPEMLVDHTVLVSVGETLDRTECLRSLAESGYRSVGTVEDPGTFAVRGGLIDVFPPQLQLPVRIELWDDEVESIRSFDPTTQRTRPETRETLFLPPVREELLIEHCIQRARLAILEAGGAVGQPTRKLQPMLDDLGHGIPFMGIEAFRPAFYEKRAVLFDYLPADTVILTFDPMAVGDALRNRWEQLSGARENAVRDGVASLEVGAHMMAPNDVQARLGQYAHLACHLVQFVDELGAVDGPETAFAFRVSTVGTVKTALEQSRGERFPLKPLAEWIRAREEDALTVFVTARQSTQLDRVERVLKNYGVTVRRDDQRPEALGVAIGHTPPGATLVLGALSEGFALESYGFAILTEHDIFGQKTRKRQRRTADATSPFLQDFRALKIGDMVVHADHGIGRYEGLKKLSMGPHEHDFLLVQFAGTDKLYVPVYKLGRLQKYTGATQTKVKLDKLGGTSWQKVRAKAKKSAEEDALALLNLYAQRELAPGYAFSAPDDFYRTFEGTFPYEETIDQARSIDEVLADMMRPQPMDRLLCGDVGFGKTEVALRAAMKAVLDGKQVSVLVPTTVLALQHYRTFRERFEKYPVAVRLFSRLVSRADQKVGLQDLAAGKVDIAIGTHRLLGADVVFQDLGLLILDEEHRFGVKHKERLKSLRTNVDVLAMTATPIPRTLQLSLSGIRDLSVITTPPMDRLSVRTYVCRATDAVVGDAIAHELGRGGQVFFVHNRVHSIESRAAWIQSLAPHARIVIGHGQMDPKALEKVMIDFTDGRYNVLVATTIIESGIDIPTANTMIIDQADRFGLAQLYQLRGRVGRARERGYCYCLVPGDAALDKEARARLAVIQKFTELGAGFHVASHDLELRGAGDLLGTKQKGHVQAVGLDMYAQLLDEAVRTLKGQAPKVDVDPDLNIKLNARIPDEYIPDNQLRLMLYRRLANAQSEDHVLAISDEIADRFGPVPPSLLNLIEAMRIRTLAKDVLIQVVDHSRDQVVFTFHPQTTVDISIILGLVKSANSQYRVPADYKLAYAFSAEERKDTLRAIRICLQTVAELVTPTIES